MITPCCDSDATIGLPARAAKPIEQATAQGQQAALLLSRIQSAITEFATG